MYEINVLVIHGYELKVASGTPTIKKTAGKESLTFYSPEMFELHILKNGQLHGVLMPGGDGRLRPLR
jgi:hypothetical protein